MVGLGRVELPTNGLGKQNALLTGSENFGLYYIRLQPLCQRHYAPKVFAELGMKVDPMFFPSLAMVPTREEMQLRAYEIHLKRGGEDGNALDEWLAAEKELSVSSQTTRTSPQSLT